VCCTPPIRGTRGGLAIGGDSLTKNVTLGRVSPWMRSNGGRYFASPRPETRRLYGAAARANLILVVLYIASVQDVILSHYVSDDEDGTG
jgi:hypothetical protein